MDYFILLIPIITVILSQILKIILTGQYQRLRLKHLMSDYGGMPSSHTALLTSLLTLILLIEGVSSPVFIITFIFSIIIVRDAMGLRRFMEEQAIIINRLVKESKKNHKKLVESIGHTPLEVAIGALFGIAITLILYFFL